MEYQEVKEWLDKVVDSLKWQKSLREFNSEIAVCIPCDSCLMPKGIEIVTDLMGIQLFHEDINYEEWKHRYSFTYRGIEFYQYEERMVI